MNMIIADADYPPIDENFCEEVQNKLIGKSDEKQVDNYKHLDKMLDSILKNLDKLTISPHTQEAVKSLYKEIIDILKSISLYLGSCSPDPETRTKLENLREKALVAKKELQDLMPPEPKGPGNQKEKQDGGWSLGWPENNSLDQDRPFLWGIPGRLLGPFLQQKW